MGEYRRSELVLEVEVDAVPNYIPGLAGVDLLFERDAYWTDVVGSVSDEVSSE